MSAKLYRLTCLTNLHMGSGEANYEVIDLEVERDPVLGEPTMNASGVKGALRDYCKQKAGKDKTKKQDVRAIFGSEVSEGSEGSGGQQGSCHFFAGDLLARPVRVSEGSGAYALATTPELLRHVLGKLHAFGLGKGFQEADIPELPEDGVLSPAAHRSVEGMEVHKGECKPLTDLLGTENWVLMSPQQLRDIDLPVMAHNALENGISKHLWYEQVVPHESVFLLMIHTPEGDGRLDSFLGEETIVQFGAGATTGNGFTRMQKLEG